MPTTAKGFRTPAGTDPLAQGDDAIRNLAADVDAFAGWVPAGGAAGAVLAKTGVGNYATAWTAPHYLPAGGAASQVLVKASAADYDAVWAAPSGGSSGPAMVRGRVAGAGTIQGGTGFSVSRTAAGSYTITFDVTFAAIPAVLATIATVVVNAHHIRTTGGTASVIQVRITDSGHATLIDADFNFLAIAV